ncbi:MAG: hypothetical protein ACRC42_00385 [Mycoplasma sp.]
MLKLAQEQYLEAKSKYTELLIDDILAKMPLLETEFQRLEDSDDFCITIREDGSQSDYYVVQTRLEYDVYDECYRLYETIEDNDHYGQRECTRKELELFEPNELSHVIWCLADELKRWKTYEKRSY